VRVATIHIHSKRGEVDKDIHLHIYREREREGKYVAFRKEYHRDRKQESSTHSSFTLFSSSLFSHVPESAFESSKLKLLRTQLRAPREW